MEPSSYQCVTSLGRESVDGELSPREDAVDVPEIADGNGGKDKFSMPTSTGEMMADFCSAVETGTMSRSIRIEKEKKKKRSERR